MCVITEENKIDKTKYRVILQIDGGGIRGITPSIVLDALTAKVNDERAKKEKKDILWHRDLSLCCGTSTGAIMAAMVCAGVSTNDIKWYYATKGKELFTEAKNILSPIIYDRQQFVDAFENILKASLIDPYMTLQDIKEDVLFMATAFNLCSMRTHFIKSNSARDKILRLSDVVTWSGLSAARYFGKIPASYEWDYINADAPPIIEKQFSAEFQDGGQGTQNCTLAYALTEIFANNWHNQANKVLLISLGTGNKTANRPFYQASSFTALDEIVEYLTREELEEESLPIQSMAAKYISDNINNNIVVYRLDYEFGSVGSDKKYKLDDIDDEAIAVYKDGAEKIIQGDTFQRLCVALAGLP